MPLEHTIVSTLEDLQAIEADWVALLDRSANNYLPMTHFWTTIWWKHFAPASNVRVHCFRIDGRLIAVVPMLSSRTNYRRLPLSQEVSMANGHSPHAGLLHDSALSPHEIASAIRTLLQSGATDLTTFLRVPESNALYSLFRDNRDHSKGTVGIRRGVVTPLIRIEGTWDAFFSKRSQKFRKNMRNKVNRFERTDGCRIERRLVRSPEDDIFREMEQVSRNSWKGKVGTDLGSVPEARVFLRDLTAQLGPTGGIHVWIAYSGPKPIAYEFHARYGGVTYPLRADFDEGHRDLSPGSVVEFTALRESFEEGSMHLYDSCANDYWYLSNWTDEMRVHYDIEVFRGVKARLAHGIEYSLVPLLRQLRKKLQRTAADDGAPKSSH